MMRKINDKEIPYPLNLKHGDEIAILTNLVDWRITGVIVVINNEVVHIYTTNDIEREYLILPRNQIIIEVIEKYDSGNKVYPSEVKKDE